jgi:tetratricopeptide (TPR) repeat protein
VKYLLLSAALVVTPAAALADSRAQKYYYEDIANPFFAPDPSRPGWYRADRAGAKESSFPAVKSTDTFRVFVIGGSIASLLQTDGRSGELAQALQSVLPSRKVEVLNCGMAGYDSYREALIEQEILEYSPDLIVLLTGHNEGIASAPIPIWIMRAQERLGRLSAYRALVKTLRPDDGEETARSDALADARDAAFARNLGDNLRHARERGVPVAVVVPPRNYREPVELGRTLYDAEFVPGWLRFLKGDYAGARRFWKESLASDAGAGASPSARKAFTWGFIARAEENLGLPDDARSSFEQAALYDRASICGAVCQGILRRVAAGEGGFVVEADRMFRALAYPRMPGLETFNDRMHWKPEFNCLMSAEIIASMRADAKLGALPWDAARARALSASCIKPGGPVGAADDLRTLSYVLMELSWPNRRQLSTTAVFYLQALRRRRPAWFKDVPALIKMTENPQTRVYGLTMAPDDVILPRFYWHIGEVLMLEKDYAGAAGNFSRALELDPRLTWARLSLAVAETLRGGKKRALAAFQAAIARAEDDPRRGSLVAAAVAAGKEAGLDEVAASDADYWLKKAEAALAAGRNRESSAALDRARALSPQAAQLRLIGQDYFLLREPEKFLEMFGALTEAYPGDVDLWLSGAKASFMTGRKEAGLAALARAEKLAPDAAQAREISALRAQGGL